MTGFKAVSTKALQQGTQRRRSEGPHTPQRKKTRKARSQLRNHYSGTSATQTRSPRQLRPLEVAARQGCDTPTVLEAFQQKKQAQPGHSVAGPPVPWGPDPDLHGGKGRGLLTGRGQWCDDSHTEGAEPTEAVYIGLTGIKHYQRLQRHSHTHHSNGQF